MRHELKIVAPMIPSLPASLRHFVSAILSDGRTESRRALTRQERSQVEAMLAHVRSVLTPAKADQVLAIIAKLLLAFPSQDLSEATAKHRADGYLMALAHYLPAWAISKGCEHWLRREHSEGSENYAFAPSPPQLARLCKLAVREAQARAAELENILKAQPDVIIEATESEVLRRAEKVRKAFEAIGVGAPKALAPKEPKVEEMASPSPELLAAEQRRRERLARQAERTA